MPSGMAVVFARVSFNGKQLVVVLTKSGVAFPPSCIEATVEANGAVVFELE